jgi:PAS domain S-box-containing protein
MRNGGGMKSNVNEMESQEDLRRRALKQLTGTNGSHEARLNAPEAFRVLHDLASSPHTAAAALALLHELQVHQVELDLQDEERRRSHADLEATVIRQAQLYDFAPVGCFTVDRITALRELNLTAARMLGYERNQLLGRTLDSFLVPQSAHALRAMLTRVNDGASTAIDALQLLSGRGAPRSVHACANRDRDGENFLIAFADVTEHGEKSAV